MRTRISPQNPHGHTRFGFAWEHIPAGGQAHLDFGSYDGKFLNSLSNKNIGQLSGVDIARDAVEGAREKFPHLDVRHITASVPLPFEDGTFSSISIMDVIEHVHDQEAVLAELGRVLADDGVLIVTVPGRHLLSFMDLGNLKFRFPRLHRWYYCRNHSLEDYRRRYVENPDGLVGDVSAEKMWHEHFSREKMGGLLERSGFEVVLFDGAGFFRRPITVFGYVFGFLGPVRRLVNWCTKLDERLFASTNLFCVARKRQVEHGAEGVT